MLTPIRIMTITGGIHGEGSLKEVLLINLGYGQPEIMKLTFAQKS